MRRAALQTLGSLLAGGALAAALLAQQGPDEPPGPPVLGAEDLIDEAQSEPRRDHYQLNVLMRRESRRDGSCE